MGKKSKKNTVSESSICWDCERSCAGCSWSRYFEPVVGWKAIPTIVNVRAFKMESFRVVECPLFKRDSIRAGLKWTDKPNAKIPKEYKNGKKKKP